MNDVQ